MSKMRLTLPEEVLLLALRDVGTVGGFYTGYALGGAVLAELMLRKQMRVEGSGRKERVRLINDDSAGDSLLDECRARIRDARRLRAPSAWVASLAGAKKLVPRVAESLRRRGILRIKETRVLWVFPRRLYLEMEMRPKREVVERLRATIFGSDGNPEPNPRTTALLALADGANLLRPLFGRKPVRGRRHHVKQLVRNDPVGRAVRGAVKAAAVATASATAGATVAITASSTST